MIGLSSMMRRIGMLSGLGVLALVLYVSPCAVAESAEADNRDPYSELSQFLRAGMEIEVDGQRKIVRLREAQGKVKQLRGESLRAWIRKITDSQSIRASVKTFSPEQKVILNSFRAIDKALSYPRELYGNFLRFYCLHLASPKGKVKEIAFEQLRRKRIEHNDFETYMDDESRQVLLEFAENNPTKGRPFEQSWGFQNAITMVGMSGEGKKAVDLLKSLGGKIPRFEFSRKVALARLTGTNVKDFIKSYRKEEDFERKSQLAAALGQISREATVKILARDLRSNRVGPHGTGFNQEVLSALCLARDWPQNAPTFTKGGFFDKEDFEVAEAWCEEQFGTKWERPKPPVRNVKLRPF